MRSLATVLEEQLALWLSIPQDRDDLRQRLRRIINSVGLYKIDVMGKTIDLRQVSSDATKGSQDIKRMLGFTDDEWQNLEFDKKASITAEIKKAVTEKLIEVKNRFFGEMLLSRLNFAWENAGESFVVITERNNIGLVNVGPPSIEGEFSLADDCSFSLHFYEAPRFYISVGFVGSLDRRAWRLYYDRLIYINLGSKNILDGVETAAEQLRELIGKGKVKKPPRWAAILALLLIHIDVYGDEKFKNALAEIYQASPTSPCVTPSFSKVETRTQGDEIEVVVKGESEIRLPKLLFSQEEDGYNIRLSATVRFSKEKIRTINITAETSFQIISAIIQTSKRKIQSSKAVALNVGDKSTKEVLDAIYRQLDTLIDATAKEIRTTAPLRALWLLLCHIDSLRFSDVVSKTYDAVETVLRRILSARIPLPSPNDIVVNTPLYMERETGRIVAPIYAKIFEHAFSLETKFTFSVPKVFMGGNGVVLALRIEKIEIRCERLDASKEITVEPQYGFSFTVSNADTSESIRERFLTTFAEFIARSVEWVLDEHLGDLVDFLWRNNPPAGGRK